MAYNLIPVELALHELCRPRGRLTIEAVRLCYQSLSPPVHLPATMHRFWEIEEMVRLVASDLEERCNASATVLALACCSKRLSDIVLDSLWEEPDDLTRLMRCLPPETWEIHDEEFVRTWVHSHFWGTHLTNRSSYVAPLSRNGSGSRAMLVGSARFTCIWMTNHRSHREHITYYLCRPRFWVLIFCQTSVPSVGASSRGTCYPSFGYSSIRSWLRSRSISPTTAYTCTDPWSSP